MIKLGATKIGFRYLVALARPLVSFESASADNFEPPRSGWKCVRRIPRALAVGVHQVLNSVDRVYREHDTFKSPMKKNPVLLVFSHVLFDWLVTGHVVEVNPAHAVRGPKHVVRKGKTPVLTAEEVRALLDSIPTVKVVKKGGVERTVPDLLGLRDRAIIGTMTYSFARVGAVVGMKISDYFVQERKRLIRLHEKGGKEHDVPCHHNLDEFLDGYIEAAGIKDDANGYLFRSASRRSGTLSRKPLSQPDVYRMVRRRAKAAGIATRIGNHTFRATGITAYLKNAGKLEVAQHIANHESPRTTKLYDRRSDDISLDEIERIGI